jgi:hypothetical protein
VENGIPFSIFNSIVESEKSERNLSKHAIYEPELAWSLIIKLIAIFLSKECVGYVLTLGAKIKNLRKMQKWWELKASKGLIIRSQTEPEPARIKTRGNFAKKICNRGL